MSGPVPPGGSPDPRQSRPVPDIAFDPVELPVGPAALEPPAPLPRIEARVEPPSPDVVLPGVAATLPGAHRGGFATPPTAPVDLPLPEPVEPVGFVPAAGTVTLPVSTSASWNPGSYALLFSICGLVASLVVGWLFPLGIIGIVFAGIALRRPGQRRRGAWGLALGLMSLAYSAGWLVYAAVQGGL